LRNLKKINNSFEELKEEKQTHLRSLRREHVELDGRRGIKVV
jgi:hypothetical protein